MDLVVAAEDLTLVADHDETVVDALGGKTSVGVALGDHSRRSHEQARALRQHIADFVKRLRGVGEEEGNRRLRPDHERDAVEPLSAAAGFGEIEIGVEDLGAVLRAPFVGLIDIGLDDAEPHAGGGGTCAREPRLSPHRAGSKRHREEEERRARC